MHKRFLFFELEPNTIVSLSAPVDVIVPFDVVGVTGSGDTIIVFELLHIPEFEVDDVSGDPKPLPLRATRLFALSVILRLRSSRNNDFNGDTWSIKEKRTMVSDCLSLCLTFFFFSLVQHETRAIWKYVKKK